MEVDYIPMQNMLRDLRRSQRLWLVYVQLYYIYGNGQGQDLCTFFSIQFRYDAFNQSELSCNTFIEMCVDMP